MGNDNKLLKLLFDRVRANPKVVCWGRPPDVIKAAQIVQVRPRFTRTKEVILELKQEIDFDKMSL